MNNRSKSDITYFFTHNYAKLKIDSYYSLILEKIITFQNIIVHNKSVWNKGQNHYYYDTLFESSNQLSKNCNDTFI